MAVVEKRMRQREAAERLGVTQRQVKRLAARYRVAGVAGLASRRRGQRPNNAIAEAKRGAILELVQQRYADFPPTLAHEKLTEGHGYRLSVETLRGWLIEAGLWQPQARRRARLHPPRERRPCVGELVQIDGSPHDWFEGRAARCCLLAFVGRRDQPFAGAAVLGGGDDAGLHADLAGVPSAARPAGCLVLGQALDLPGQPTGSRGRVDTVHAGAKGTRHRAHSCPHAAGEGPRGKGFSDPANTLAAGVAAAGSGRDRRRQRLSAPLQGRLLTRASAKRRAASRMHTAR